MDQAMEGLFETYLEIQALIDVLSCGDDTLQDDLW